MITVEQHVVERLLAGLLISVAVVDHEALEGYATWLSVTGLEILVYGVVATT